MNEYYELWLDHKEQFEMPTIPTGETNSDGPYWTVERGMRVHSAAGHTRRAFTVATAVAAVDGPLPFADVLAYSAATLYSAAWWTYALS